MTIDDLKNVYFEKFAEAYENKDTGAAAELEALKAAIAAAETK